MPLIQSPHTVRALNAPEDKPQAEHAGANQISEDLVNQVADRVMALLLQDLKFERERRRSIARSDRVKGVR
ncbi:MAG: hypothetical protein MUC85_00565 [Anaerolineales bacterium]|jgi:hypothetical protein|nr:hypothetical protein [Anaerolineales bacterium]